MILHKLLLRPRTLQSLVPRNDFGTHKKTYYRSRIVFSTFLVAVFGIGCALTYVNYNPQLRDNLKKQSAILDEVIQFLWQEKKTFKQRIDEIIPPKEN
ncbi:unnamed protein product [Macrosiphum euphorbiae]|uniref:Uncharacterized protein n=1 Tax=Macrosiphum euphorbiae TaxID=13131 RepID=A0AAV0WPF1_9HEMI|nr:unnamed protein product [Macrosiphum euphorbiae]